MHAFAERRAASAASYGVAAVAAALIARTPGPLFAVKLLVVAPVVEELFFRGVVQRWLLARLRGAPSRPWSASNVLTAAAFGAAHLVYSTPLFAAAVIAPALAIGFVYERTRRIDLCIGLHAACNAFWLTFMGAVR